MVLTFLRLGKLLSSEIFLTIFHLLLVWTFPYRRNDNGELNAYGTMANNFGHTHLFADDNYLVTPKKGYVDICYLDNANVIEKGLSEMRGWFSSFI
jgi:hypothetical protein